MIISRLPIIVRSAPSQPSALAVMWGACVLVSALVCTPAHADESANKHGTVNFSTSSAVEVTQDLMTVTLQASKEGAQAAEVQAALKQVLEGALAEARKSAMPGALDVRTGGFSVLPRYNNSGRINGWQGTAQLMLSGTDIARISQVSGRLNQLNVVNVAYGLSKALREKHESELTSQAIARFRVRATQIASDFGLKGYTLGDLSVSSTEPGFEPRPYMMAMRAKSAESADAPLPTEPGKGVLSVTVSGQVLLTP